MEHHHTSHETDEEKAMFEVEYTINYKTDFG